ncbi:LysR family transcriptional regulator [Chenggangzhangella methanolivorans]|uniref:LysR family transcriptional regulator n=1 Tax=Chenggangzhangella methanolivorans TaxID=1437009 RepID=A0A9E6R7A4_9HYPH|nr:LysR family transcriptional regulator [Chenggangzhangella methanolivorans]QZN98721.1 LysR family transcriptional regulator [Chenggangzhangella methanolivorans]
MDHLDGLRLFARIVERRSFTAAASDLALPRSTATEAIRRLEARLGARLLERTTRVVTPTLDGRHFYERCVAILADIEDAEATLRSGEPHGLLRVDAPGLLTRTFLLPELPAFLERHPKVDVQFGQSERLVDLVREGVDCAIRVGEPADSALAMRRLGALPEVTVASPAYLDRRGTPGAIGDLDGHEMVGFVSSRTGEILPLEFVIEGETRRIVLLSRTASNDADTNADLARLGFGLVQAPRYRFEPELADGTLVEVLPQFPPSPTALSALFPQTRQVTPRLRVFLDWVAGLFRGA